MKRFSVGALLRPTLRAAIPATILVACLFALANRLAEVSFSEVMMRLGAVAPAAWVSGLLLTMVSLAALGRYDAVAHRHIRSATSERQARWSGTLAIALSQTLGFGILTGALVRWRMLPALTAPQALRLSAFVSISFMAALAIAVSVAVVLLPAPEWAFWPGVAFLAGLPFLIWWRLIARGDKFFGQSISLPTLPACGGIFGWALIDLLAAGAVLYVLIPTESNTGFSTFFPIYLLALCAALLSGTPGGIGPFELMLFALLPGVPAADLACGLLAYRMLYHALPAVISVLALSRPLRPETTTGTTSTYSQVPWDVLRSETGVLRQNGGRWFTDGSSALPLWPTGQTLTCLFDPETRDPIAALELLQRAARAENRVACLYKGSSEFGLAARRLGWPVLHIADEAVLNPLRFETTISAMSSLRRKLRSAVRAGVRIDAPDSLPWDQMAAVDAAWLAMRGSARGGTMGRYAPDYLANQHVVLAWQGDRLCAFASFHTGRREWCLDVMRNEADAPDGTMQALVTHALATAAQRGISRFSLAATPACPDPNSALYRLLARQIVKRSGGPGLRQFKSIFAPRWEPRYIAAPSRRSLLLATIDIALSIARPTPLAEPIYVEIHNQDENYEFASRRAS